MDKKLTQARLKELLHYNPETGVFTWKVNKGKRIKRNAIAGCTQRGHTVIGVDWKTYYGKKLAWLYMEGFFPKNMIIWYRNNIRQDIRWKNLYILSHQCRVRGNKAHKTNKSGITGVCWNKETSKWRAYVAEHEKYIHLGRFESKAEAVQARWEGEKKYNYPSCQTTSTAYLYLKEHNLL